MRITIIAYEFPPRLGGMETYAFEIAKRLSASHDVTVMCRVQNNDPAYYKKIGLKAKIRPFLTGVLPVDIDTVSDFLISGKQDVVHIMNAGFSVAVKRMQQAGVPVVVTANGKDFLQPWICRDKKLIMKGLQSCDKVLSVSEVVKRRLRKMGVARNVIVTHHGTDTVLFRPMKKDRRMLKRLGIHPENPVIMTSCRVVEKKNLEAVIKALPSARNATYVIAGPAGDQEYLEKLTAMAKRLAVSDRVRFLGAIEYKELPKYYNLADAYIMLSEERSKGDIESFGIAYLEALSCGKPVIVSRNAGVARLVENRKVGFVVNPKNRKEVAAALKKLLENRGMNKMMGKEGRRLVTQEFDWDLCVKTVVGLYSMLLQKKAKMTSRRKTIREETENVRLKLKKNKVDADSGVNDKEGAALLSCAARLHLEGCIVELGSYKGRSTVWLASGSRLSGSRKVYAVDRFTFNERGQKQYGNPPDAEPIFDRNTAACHVKDIVVKIKGDFAKIAETWDTPIKLLFIDGDHTYDGTKRNFFNWEPHLVAGGVIAFHDSNDKYQGVISVIEEYVKGSGRFHEFLVVGKITFARKIR